jgi:hypothetical protein
VFDQLRDPGRVGHIGLAAGHVACAGRSCDNAVSVITCLLTLPDRLPRVVEVAQRESPHADKAGLPENINL